jgi:hypothetical protein
LDGDQARLGFALVFIIEDVVVIFKLRVVEANPERPASVTFSALKSIVADTKSWSVKTTITTARTRNRLVPNFDVKHTGGVAII